MGNLADKEEVIFQATEDHLETGMRGFPVGYCVTSSVDPQKGLFYGGRPVSDMAKWSPEEVMYCLYSKKQGSSEEVAAFAKELQTRATVSAEVVQAIENFPKKGHPMKWFCSALLTLGMCEGTGDYEEDCLNVLAKLPLLAALVINKHAGFPALREAKPELGYMENFTQMLNVPAADAARLTEVFRLFNVLHYDHGGGNLSCFVGKAIASGLEDMYGSLAGAMTALAGPRHGKANQDCLEFVHEVLEELGPEASADQVEELVRKRLSNKQLVFGFGHAVLRVEDPRATIQYALSEEKYATNPLVRIALHLRERGPKVLKENPKISNPYPNVDAISGTLLTAAGFAYPQYYTVLFGLSRCVGIAIQIVYERCQARGGKGTPIVRPKYFFKGQA